MTEIERLRELARGISPVTSTCVATTLKYDREHPEMVETSLRLVLSDIADQIEREQDKVTRTDWESVRDVRDDMARHVFVIAETDALVDEWVRKLDDALDGRERRDPAADVSVSAYDLLPEEDREALAWVRDYGGIEVLRRMFQDADNRRVELCGALGIDLDKGWSEAMAAMRLRLMPEGGWPRFKDGEMVLVGSDFADGLGETHTVTSVEFFEGCVELHWNPDEPSEFEWLKPGERVRRPAPKVLDADGEEIGIGDKLYDTETGCARIVRCRDCRRSFEERGELWCRGIVGPPIEPEGFCAWGERREEDS